MRKFNLIFLFIILFSCKKDDPITYEVDPDFESYVQLFIDKAAERGKTIDFSDTGLIVEYSDQVNEGASGWCFLGQHHIIIDKAEWELLTEDEKEFLMAHELGHCELDRRHRNDQFSNGLWHSLMRGDPLSSLQGRTPVTFYGFRKDYYWDELFDENIAAATWGNASFQIDEIANSDKELVQERTNLISLLESTNIGTSDFEFEIEFENIPAQSRLTELSWGGDGRSYFLKIYNNFGLYIGVAEAGKEQLLYYSNNISTYNSSPFSKITIRQHDSFSQVFLNDEFVFHLDPLPNSLVQIKLQSKDAQNNLVPNFKIEKYTLNKLL